MEAIHREKLFSLSNSVKLLLAKIGSTDLADSFRKTKLDASLLTKLKRRLTRIVVLLNDDAVFNEWFDMVRDAVFELESLFDEINTEALRRKVEAEYKTLTPSSTSLSQVLKYTIYSPFKPFKRFNKVIKSKLLKSIERLELLSSGSGEKGKLGVSNSNGVWLKTPEIENSDVLDENFIYGRDSDISKLKTFLLSEDDASEGDCKVRMVSIVGMGGIGKTALAKLLYNDPQVKEKFGLRGWALVSKDFVVFKVLEAFLNSIDSQTMRNDEVNREVIEFANTKRNEPGDLYANLVLLMFKKIISNNLFLLVLDNVWGAESVNWTHLMNIFNVGEKGSRIIVTTRDERIALSKETFLSVHYLNPLTSEDCWFLLARNAFGACEDQEQSNLEEIGKEIAKKCYGLPFLAVALGDFLRNKLSPDYWNYVLESNIWELTDHDVQPFLQLSYNYLPTPLKRCFAYFSIFPKKSIIEKNMVVQLWIAEGLVESSTDSTDLEKVGEEYFDVLVSRSLIHRRSIGDEEATFEMHDVFHDLAIEVSSPYCVHLDDHNLHDTVHNLSYNRGIYDSHDKFKKLYGLKSLRTFLALPLQEQSPLCLLSNKIVDDLLPTMKQLRVLSLSNYKSITEVPNSIGNLLYLQYLNLSHTKIERLPSETCKLYNLQFLLLAGCKRLIELPEDIGKLVNLRLLDVSETALREMPVQIAKLENLHTLSDFVVSKYNDGLKVSELGKFPHLQGKLSISQLQNVNDPSEVDQANLKMKELIDKLALEWDYGNTFPDSQIKSVILEHLQPSTNLKSLTIKGYGGINFPNWLGDSSFRNMVYLRISNCNDCLWLPPLGQLSNLKELIIEGMQSVGTIGIEFYGSGGSSFQPFPSLEKLHFENMQEWEEWDLIRGTTTTFPSLKTLSFSKCPKLIVGNIADKFPSLTKLELSECPLLVQSMPLSDRVFRQLMFPLNSLQQLTIDGIPSSMSFPSNGLPKTLKFLIISNCENLEFLPHDYLSNYTSLEELKISYSCNSMTSFALGALPVLKRLFIEGCKNLKSILIAEDTSLKCLSFLRSIKIWDCTELESFPPGGLATPNLVYFAVWKCEKLPSLPEAMHTLTNLQEMEVDNLPNLQSFVIDDLPSSLQELTVGSVGGIMWNTKPTWEHLTCLSVLRINDGNTVTTLMGPFLPPSSLVTLCIYGLVDTSIEGKWLQHLDYFQNLEIVNAPKLKTLPKKGLPSSLLVLSITRCPLLEASLRRKRGREWRKIAHIPAIIIDDELIT